MACQLYSSKQRSYLAMMEEIRKFIMTDAHTYILPQRESTRCEGARVLLKTPTALYYLFPLKDQISKDKFCKLLSGNLDSATPKLRKWLHVTDLCAMCPKRLIAIRYMRSLVANIANTALSAQNSSNGSASSQRPKLAKFITNIVENSIGTRPKVTSSMKVIVSVMVFDWLPPIPQEHGQRCL